MTTCSCCGEERDRLVSLKCHDDIKVCPECIGWLRANADIIDSTPILPVIDMAASVAFYRAAGFEVREYEEGGGYAFVTHDDESVFDLDQADVQISPETNGAACYLIVPDVDSWHTRLRNAGHEITDLVDQPWGMREFTLTDPNGNHLRFGHNTAD
jgi:catechol 2,3-dioxygenase-like lactoylglutathione lyase family enzyme